jgi:hypothetical protein
LLFDPCKHFAGQKNIRDDPFACIALDRINCIAACAGFTFPYHNCLRITLIKNIRSFNFTRGWSFLPALFILGLHGSVNLGNQGKKKPFSFREEGLKRHIKGHFFLAPARLPGENGRYYPTFIREWSDPVRSLVFITHWWG